MEESKVAPDDDSADLGADEVQVSPDVSTLIAMGFARDRAEAALAGAHGNFDRALEQLLGRSRRSEITHGNGANEMPAVGGSAATGMGVRQFSVGMAVL